MALYGTKLISLKAKVTKGTECDNLDPCCLGLVVAHCFSFVCFHLINFTRTGKNIFAPVLSFMVIFFSGMTHTAKYFPENITTLTPCSKQEKQR